MSVHVVQHPIAQDALIALREHSTPPAQFRRLTHRLSLILIAEATRDLPTEATTVQSPLEAVTGQTIRTRVVVVPVVRAGLGMLDAVLELLPQAQVGHIGLQRDETTAMASQYFSKVPRDLDRATVLLVDPMLATGGSAIAAADLIKRAGARVVRLVCIVAAPEGIAAFSEAHPDIQIFTPVIDRQLNAQKYILPGLGDFGDRLYGT